MFHRASKLAKKLYILQNVPQSFEISKETSVLQNVTYSFGFSKSLVNTVLNLIKEVEYHE
jgi:ABC-type phosphate/phosphonate transport system ATPase subunit